MRLPIALLLAASCLSPANAQHRPPSVSKAELAPLDASVVEGRLPNGFRYFIKRNDKPADRIDIRLVLGAGTIQETIGQREHAHLIEHLVANYVNLPGKQTIWAWVPGWGGVVGRDFNAATSDAFTNYRLSIPSKRPDLLREALLIQRGWAQGATFSDEDIARERKAVANEMTRGMDWRKRLGDRLYNYLRDNDPRLDISFANRLKSVQQGDPASVRRFYHDWYRPELEALIVVGDVDPAAIEAQVEALFADLKPLPGGPAPVKPVAPIKPGLRYAMISDPSAPVMELNIIDAWRAPAGKPEAILRDDLTGKLVEAMIAQREQRSQSSPTSVLRVSDDSRSGSSISKASDGVATLWTGYRVYEDNIPDAIGELYDIRRSIATLGFTSVELADAKEQLLKQLTSVDVPANESLVGSYESHFVEGRPAMGKAEGDAYYRSLIASIGLGEINRWAKCAIDSGSRDIILTVPEKLAGRAPSPAIVDGWLKAAVRRAVVPYEPPQAIALIEPKPFGIYTGTPQITEFPGIGARRIFIPENNVTILLRPKPTSGRMIELSGIRLGGTDEYKGIDNLNARAAYLGTAWTIGGVDEFDQMRLRVAHDIWLSREFEEDSVEILGGANPEGFEKFLKLYRAAFEVSPPDAAAFQAWLKRTRRYFDNRIQDPVTKFYEERSKANEPAGVDRLEVGPDTLDRIDYEAARRFYSRFLGNASDFLFVVEGNFDPDTIGPLVTRYLGTLPPSTPASPPVPAPPVALPAETRTIYSGSDLKASVRLAYTGLGEIPFGERPVLGALYNILRARLKDRLREKERGTYAVSVNTIAAYGEINAGISFDTAPDSVERMVKATRGEIERLQRDGPTADEVKDAVELEATYRRDRVKGVRYWKSYFTEHYLKAGRTGRGLEPAEESVPTVDAVRDHARVLLTPLRLNQLVVLPESMDPARK